MHLYKARIDARWERCVCSGGERQKIWIDSGLVIDRLKKGQSQLVEKRVFLDFQPTASRLSHSPNATQAAYPMPLTFCHSRSSSILYI